MTFTQTRLGSTASFGYMSPRQNTSHSDPNKRVGQSLSGPPRDPMHVCGVAPEPEFVSEVQTVADGLLTGALIAGGYVAGSAAERAIRNKFRTLRKK